MIETGPFAVGGGTGADAGTSHQGDGDIAAELARARDRLAFYESFDELIQHNVQRSGELLRRLAAEQEQTEQKLRDMQSEVDRRLNEQRSVLEQIASSLDGLRSNLDTMTSQVSASLSSLLPPVASVPPPTGAGDVPVLPEYGRAGEPGMGGPPDLGSETASATLPGSTTERVPAPTAMTDEMPAGNPPPGQPLVAVSQEQATPSLVQALGGQPAKPRKVDLIIHGVPNAATALSLQRHLQDVPSVETVEVREYVSGVLRFQVLATSLGVDDLRGWPGGGVEVITARGHVLELKLPTAEGF